MYLVSNSQMKAIEERAIHAGVPSLLLMENAAASVTRVILKDGYKNILLLCGKGNNGGDGFACGRQLFAHGARVKIILIGNEATATPDCKTNIMACKALDIPIYYYGRDIEDVSRLREYFEDCDVIVDALVGTGLNSSLHEPLASVVGAVNASGKPVYAVDCPTGVSTDTGEDYEGGIYAHKTITFHMAKTGLLLHPACRHTEELIIGNISLPMDGHTNVRVLDKEDAANMMPARPPKSNKNTYGKLYALVGCDHMTGAAYLAAKSAYRIGCGLVYAYATEGCSSILRNKLPEAVVTTMNDMEGYLSAPLDVDMSPASCVLIGCGLGCNPVTQGFLKDVLGKVSSPLVIDADGLNIISGDEDLKRTLPHNTVITPHPKEMSRLCGKSVEDILSDPLNTALGFAKEYGVITVLKDYRTIIAAPDGRVTINITGTPAMSKGGSGDCLAGVIAGLIAQGVDPYDAASLGCYINGKAGELAQERLSVYGVLAEDMIEEIPRVFK